VKQVLAVGLLMLVQPAAAQSVPGQCVQTMITALGHRLEDGRTGRAIPGSGSTVTFSNKVGLVGYEELPQIARARVGDRAMLCLVALPTGCPPGDNRGRTYTATDLRTHESWTLSDSEHSCGGA